MDKLLESAIDLARSAAIEEAGKADYVGEHVGAVEEGTRVVTHTFDSRLPGYRGWQWSVVLSRIPRGRKVTVSEVVLLPAEEAVLAPPWLPWAQRLRPTDIGPGDVLEYVADDERLETGLPSPESFTMDDVEFYELRLARDRVLTPAGRQLAAQRWYAGPHGPTTTGSVASAAGCASCGFFVPLSGELGRVFGVCANEWSPDDGKVVSTDHGCGAHSQTDVSVASRWPDASALIDETEVEEVEVPQPAQNEAAASSTEPQETKPKEASEDNSEAAENTSENEN